MEFIRGIDWCPSFLKFMTSKKIILSLKRNDFQKHHLFNKSNLKSMEIIHDSTFLYIVHAIGRGITLEPLFLKNMPYKKKYFIS